ncbi:hypothetical protein ALT_3064 [Aspergillus lentulus]|uniref:Uncharacterized protein n=1 Tax=Aspergillus lentulus TaxID=293939 RepID=A0AAN4PG44_ASPLE|nr:hypothetical protein ALT_3064 [Aspergillus lentulus]
MGEMAPRPSSPDSFNDFFHHKSWPEPWTSPDFPPDESWQERYRRFPSYPWWKADRAAIFFEEYYLSMWPWGYFIYRTCYENVSEADWKEAMRKLDAYVYCFLRSHQAYGDPEPYRRYWHPEPIRLICEGYRNVVIEDRELLEGASVHLVRQLFNDWMTRHDQEGDPRSEFCLMIDDKALQSILKSPEPSEDHSFRSRSDAGYVILIDRRFQEGDIITDHENYQGFLRLDITGLWSFTDDYQQYDFWRKMPYIPRPGLIPCISGSFTHVEDEDGTVVAAGPFSNRSNVIGKNPRAIS